MKFTTYFSYIFLIGNTMFSSLSICLDMDVSFALLGALISLLCTKYQQKHEFCMGSHHVLFPWFFISFHYLSHYKALFYSPKIWSEFLAKRIDMQYCCSRKTCVFGSALTIMEKWMANQENLKILRRINDDIFKQTLILVPKEDDVAFLK